MRSLTRSRWWPGMATLLVATLCVATVSALSDGPMYTRQQRFGIAFVPSVDTPSGSASQSLGEYSVAPLQVGWYSDGQFSASPPMPADGDIEYVQILRVGDDSWPPDWTQVRNAVEFYRLATDKGAIWVIGNEPECPNQDNLTPATYAARYYEAFIRMRGWDPTAQIAIGGISEPTPLRLRWLDKVLEAYQQQNGEPMVVDVWNIHVQILSEGAETEGGGYDDKAGVGLPVGIDPVVEGLAPREYPLADCVRVDVFQQMVRDFREWMAQKGEQEKPLIISQMGVLQSSLLLSEEGTDAERKERGDHLIEQFMVDAFDWLLSETDQVIGCPADGHRLAQRWLWFSLNSSFWDEANPKGVNGSLYNYETREPTRFGRRFISYRTENALYIPLVLRQPMPTLPHTSR